MQIGSLVKCVNSFEDLRDEWGFDYPVVGEVLTVSDIQRHPTPDVDALGIVLLFFEEHHLPFGVCDKQVDGTVNFIELIPPISVEEEVMEEVI